MSHEYRISRMLTDFELFSSRLSRYERKRSPAVCSYYVYRLSYASSSRGGGERSFYQFHAYRRSRKDSRSERDVISGFDFHIPIVFERHVTTGISWNVWERFGGRARRRVENGVIDVSNLLSRSSTSSYEPHASAGFFAGRNRFDNVSSRIRRIPYSYVIAQFSCDRLRIQVVTGSRYVYVVFELHVVSNVRENVFQSEAFIQKELVRIRSCDLVRRLDDAAVQYPVVRVVQFAYLHAYW